MPFLYRTDRIVRVDWLIYWAPGSLGAASLSALLESLHSRGLCTCVVRSS